MPTRTIRGPKPELIDKAKREQITDAVCAVMHAHWRDDSIDGLLCRPYDAIAMAKLVCEQLQLAATKDNVNRICRVALSARKRGDLRTDRY